jgi:hypothetical protein
VAVAALDVENNAPHTHATGGVSGITKKDSVFFKVLLLPLLRKRQINPGITQQTCFHSAEVHVWSEFNSPSEIPRSKQTCIHSGPLFTKSGTLYDAILSNFYNR